MTDQTDDAAMAAAEEAAVALNQPAQAQQDDRTTQAQGDEQTPGDDAPAAQPTDEAGEQPKPKKSAKDRIDELTWRLRESERREAQLLDRIGGKQTPAQEAQPQAQQGDGRPDPTAYDGGVYDPQYIEDLTDYKADQAVTRRLNANKAQETVQTQLGNYQSKVAELYPDGVTEGLEAFHSLPAVPQGISEAILASDIGPKLGEYLGDNPREFQRISGLSPALQARELTLLEHRLSAPTEAPKPTPKTLTAAPEPPPQARGSGGRFQVAADTSDFAAFEQQYLKRGG